MKPGSQSPALDRATEDRILDAADAVFRRRGTAGARMQDIADEAGVNKALLHYYFRSKERLASAVFHRGAQQLFPALFQLLASDLDLDTKVHRVVELELDRLQAAPFLPAYILSELHHHPERGAELISTVAGARPEQIADRLFGTLRRQIKERVDAGTMRPISAEDFVVNLLSLCIFPFAARPLLMAIRGLDEAGFGRTMAKRKRDLPEFFLSALRP
jgi:AcrR family transcriptional regulator